MFSLKAFKFVTYVLIICVLLKYVLSICRGYFSMDLVRHDKSGILGSRLDFACDSDVEFSNEPDRDWTFQNHIHQIFFYETDIVIPDRLEVARKTWIHRQPDFRYTLWNATMIENLIIAKYPSLLKVYQSYTHWVRRADMARYVVLYEHGGVYVDIDIKSKRKSLHALLSSLKSTTGIALYVSKPAFVSNDFMVAKPKHPFMKSVLCGLDNANKWYILPYVTTMLSTGPLYLHYQMKKHEPKGGIEIIPEVKLWDFITHITGSSWHQWDAKVVWWIFVNRNTVLYICLAMISVSICLVLLIKYRNDINCYKRKCTINYPN